ncbi:hypothetical protein DMUE_3898 [Dictyocoela muelleri]|nr:hypothetical protein DMUE_3898 [Dictyocoela muelleri]
MKITKKLQLTAKEKISNIDTYVDTNPENTHKMTLNIVWIFKYLCDYGMQKRLNFKNDKDIKRLPEIIKRQFKYFDHAFIVCEYPDIVTCYEVLKMRSGIRFLMDIFCENDDELKNKLNELDNHLVDYSEKWPGVVDYYYEAEKMMDDPNENYIDFEFHFQGECIVNMKGVPESHSWWPYFCRKK